MSETPYFAFLSPHDPYYYLYIGGFAAVGLLFYWLLWKKHARVANFIVFFALSALIWYLVDWNYLLNDYFRVTQWRIPSN